jgi:hypothetical protein
MRKPGDEKERLMVSNSRRWVLNLTITGELNARNPVIQ